jgi:tetratricopeptide (TPR) repeat protein
MALFAAGDTFFRSYESLAPEDRQQLREAVSELMHAFARGGDFPASLQVKPVADAEGLYEMSWAADGKATFSIRWDPARDERVIFLRRVGKVAMPLLEPSPPAMHQLPPMVRDFTNREDLVHQVLRQFEEPEGTASPVIVTIVGKPGVGKSTLAVYVAHRLQSRYPDGQLFLDLQDMEFKQLDPTAALGSLLGALGLENMIIPTALRERAALYRSQLSNRRILVVLENASSEAQVQPLLPGSSRCGVLITSRTQLAGLQGAVTVNVEVMKPDSAVEFLRRVAGTERVDGELDAAKAIVKLCGYLPLAIRIAGMRLRARPRWSLDDLAARLTREHLRLSELAIGDLEVRASFRINYASLSAEDKRTFRLLGILEAPHFGIEVVAALQGSSVDAAETSLGRLVDVQLLETAPRGRYAFHDLLRVFARELLSQEEPEDERHAALERVVRWYLQLVEDANVAIRGLGGQGDEALPLTDALKRLDEEYPGPVVAVREAVASGLHEPAVQLALGLVPFFEVRSYLSDWELTHQRALEAARAMGDRSAEAAILHSLGVVLREQRRYNEALLCFEDALAIRRQAKDRDGEALTLSELGLLYNDQRRFKEATAYFQQSLMLLEGVKDHHGEAVARKYLGIGYREQGLFDQAQDSLENSRQIFRESGDRYNEAWVLYHIGILYRVQDRLDEAIEYFTKSLELLRRVGDRYGEGWNLNRLGVIYRKQGRLDKAGSLSEQAREILGQVDDPWGEAWALNHLGEVRRRQGRLDEALQLHQRALAIFRGRGRNRRSEAYTLRLIGLVQQARGDWGAAHETFAGAIAILRDFGERELEDFGSSLDDEDASRPSDS